MSLAANVAMNVMQMKKQSRMGMQPGGPVRQGN